MFVAARITMIVVFIKNSWVMQMLIVMDEMNQDEQRGISSARITHKTVM